MLRKLAFTIVATSLVCAAFVMIAVVVDAYRKTVAAKERIKSIPYTAPIFDLDSVRFAFPSGKPLVIILYNSSCSNCVSELELLENNVSELERANIVFLSAEPISKLKSVAQRFHFHKNAYFGKLSDDTLFEYFGVVSYPAILIYDFEGKLNRMFSGEVTIEAISKHIPK